MNIPGFTAEATCYPTNRHNHTLGISAPIDAAIYPARELDPGCYDDCTIRFVVIPGSEPRILWTARA